MKKNLTRRKNGSYVLKHKTKKAKQGDCLECGENATTRELLFRYNPEDLKLVKEYIEAQLSRYTNEESITPIWCKTCQSLIEYRTKIRTSAT